MRLYLMPGSYDHSGLLRLRGNDFHHLIRVLRYREGFQFCGRDDSGNIYKLKVQKIAGDECLLNVEISGRDLIRLPEINLYQCLCKGKKMDQIIRQATETGVYRIIPVLSEFSVSRPEYAMSIGEDSSKMSRWWKITKEAVQQSGSMVDTQINTPVLMNDLPFMDGNNEIGLFFHQEALEHNTLHEYLSPIPEKVSLIIGPEGGLSDRETEALMRKNYKPMFLRTNVLRAETAALYAVSSVQTLLLERENWKRKV